MKLTTRLTICISCVLALAGVGARAAFSQVAGKARAATQPGLLAPGSALIWVSVDSRIKISKLQPGNPVEGKLERAIYWQDREVIPKGSSVRLVVETIERKKKPSQPDDRAFAIRLFAPRHESMVTFQPASVSLPNGSEVPLHVEFIRYTKNKEIQAATRKSGSTGTNAEDAGKKEPQNDARQRPPSDFSLLLRAKPAGVPFSELPSVASANPTTETEEPAKTTMVPAGTHASLVLLDGLSASRSQTGESFQAMVIEPVRVGSVIAIPEGSIIEGRVTKRVPPRRLSRPGSLYVEFTELKLPAGIETKVVASPSGAEVASNSNVHMDSEGGMHGGPPGMARLLLDVGVTAGLAKVTDDTTQLIIEAIVSTATDASTAGTARIAATCVSGIFLATRHGRDVILPEYSQLEISFSRAFPVADSLGAGDSLQTMPRGTEAARRKKMGRPDGDKAGPVAPE